MENNIINIEALAQMVANKINNRVAGCPLKEKEGGPWAKKSKLYGTEVFGIMYNPYMVRRWLPKQFRKLVNTFVHNGQKYASIYDTLRKTVSSMYMLKFVTEECRILSILEKRDVIAYDERSMFFTKDFMKQFVKNYGKECCSVDRLSVEEYKRYNVNAHNAKTYNDLYKVLVCLPKAKVSMNKFAEFSRNYVYAGVYYTLKQDVMYLKRTLQIVEDNLNQIFMPCKETLDYLRKIADSDEKWRLWAIYKNTYKETFNK